MKDTVSSLIKKNVFPCPEILTENSGLEQFVCNMTVADVPEIYRLVQPGEMILAGNFVHTLASKEMATILASHGCCGVVSQSRFRSFFTAEVIYAFAYAKIPVLLIKDDIKWENVLSSFYRVLLGKSYRLFDESFLLQKQLVDSIMQSKKPKNFCTVVAEMLNVEVTLVSDTYNLIETSGSIKEWQELLTQFSINDAFYRPQLISNLNGQPIEGYIYHSDILKKQRNKWFILPISSGYKHSGCIILSMHEDFSYFSPQEILKIQQILMVAAIEIIKSNELTNTSRRYYNYMLEELLEPNQADLARLAKRYGVSEKELFDSYRVCILSVSREHEEHSMREFIPNQHYETFYEKIKLLLDRKDFFIFERANQFVLILPTKAFHRRSDQTERLVGLFSELMGRSPSGLGISEPISAQNIRKGYDQAVKALHISVKSEKSDPFFYEDLGVLRYFFDRQGYADTSALIETYQKMISPILKYDEKHHTELLLTIEVYLEKHFSPTQTCKMLFIHRNTLYARLEKISSILGEDVEDTETLFNLQMGLKVRQLLLAGIIPSSSC